MLKGVERRRGRRGSGKRSEREREGLRGSRERKGRGGKKERRGVVVKARDGEDRGERGKREAGKAKRI